jgi:hypothetical protein
VLRRADVADAAKVTGVDLPARVRTAADLPKLHRPWLVAQAAGWLRVDAGVAIGQTDSAASGDPLEVWSAGLAAVLREESHDRRRRGATLACATVLMALATDPPAPREQLEDAVHALLDHSRLGDITAMYEAFRRGIMPVDAALEVLAEFGAVDDANQPTLTPLGRRAWEQLRPAITGGLPDTEHLSAGDVLAALTSVDESDAVALARSWFNDRPLAHGCRQLLEAAAGASAAERIAVVDLVASFGDVTVPVWRDALAVPNLGTHAAAVLAYLGQGPDLTGPQEAWLASEYAVATLAADGVEDAHHEVRDYGGLVALEAGAHPDLAVLRRAIEDFTASGARLRVFQLKIALDRMRPPVWRRVLVPASATLGDLHRIIKVVLGWGDDHLHLFSTDSGRFADAYHGLDDCDDEDTIRLSRALPQLGATLRYVYDFGDDWRHTITLEKVDQPDTPPDHPVCVAGRGDAPVEDWHPDDSDHPDGTTPFDRDAINAALAEKYGPG